MTPETQLFCLYFTAAYFTLSILLKLRTIFNFRNNVNPFDKSPLNWIQKLNYGSMSEFAQVWNGYEVHGLDKVDHKNSLLVGYHSRSTLDLLYLQAAIQSHVLISHLLFHIPVLGYALHLLGAVPSKGGVKDKAEAGFIKALSEGERPLMLLPGGAFECLKRHEDIEKVNWKKEPGFARVIVAEKEALGSKTRVIPFYTKNCEHALWTSKWWYTYSGESVRSAMDKIHHGNVIILPYTMVMLLFSLGMFLVPKPIKMDTYLSETHLILRDNETAEAFAKRVSDALQALIIEVESKPERPFPHGKLSMLMLILYGTYTAIQTLWMNVFGVVFFIGIGLPLTFVYTSVTKLFFKKKRSEDNKDEKMKEKKEE